MFTSELIDREARKLSAAGGAKRPTSARSANARATPGWPAHRRECPAITYMAMGFRPRSFPVGGVCEGYWAVDES